MTHSRFSRLPVCQATDRGTLVQMRRQAWPRASRHLCELAPLARRDSANMHACGWRATHHAYARIIALQYPSVYRVATRAKVGCYCSWTTVRRVVREMPWCAAVVQRTTCSFAHSTLCMYRQVLVNRRSGKWTRRVFSVRCGEIDMGLKPALAS